MAYVKVPKPCQDYVVGIRDVNQVHDNQEQIRADFNAKHGDLLPGAATTLPLGVPNWQISGQHDDVFIPRAAVRVDVAKLSVGGQTQVTWGVDLFHPVSVVLGVQRLLPGIYHVATGHLEPMAWAVAQPLNTDSTKVQIANARYYSSAAGAVLPGFYVMLYELAAGEFSLADFSFSLVIHSTE